MRHQGTFVVTAGEGEPLLEAVERGLGSSAADLAALPVLGSVALGDPYLAAQLAALHARFELRPPQPRGLLGRLRAHLAWWLLGPELQHMNATNATLIRVIDSLLAQIDSDRAKVQRVEEQLAFREPIS
jgi:hypothetical protein